MSVEQQVFSFESAKGFDLHALCASESVIEFRNFDGQVMKFVPNSTLGFFEFEFSFGFPVVNEYGTALHPSVIAKSYQTLMNQCLNYEHRMNFYDQKVDDRIIGHIVAVNFPMTPAGGWQIGKSKSKSPHVSGVAAFYKRSQGLKRILGQHVTGQHNWSVSMEVDWTMAEAGFAVDLGTKRNGSGKHEYGDPIMKESPQDFLDAGFEYIPADKAPKDLVDTFSTKKNRVVSTWGGRGVNVLVGGLNANVHYAGLALARTHAEGPAKINRLVASSEAASISQVMNDLDLAIRETVAGKIIKK